jgi:hypothetical protein
MEEKENHPSWPWVKWFQSIGAQFIGLRIYANNAAAVAGGLKVGDLYRTGADPDLICVVH